MKIIDKAINEIIPYEFNNKEHPEEQINKIANSIKEFGFTQPIVIDENNIIIIGHGRYEAAKKLGLKKVPVLQIKNLTEAQIKKLRILDNKLNESEWNLENLKLELDSLNNDLSFGDLKLKAEDLFPEFDAPEFNPDDYIDNLGKEEDEKIVIKIQLIKKNLEENNISLEEIQQTIIDYLENLNLDYELK